MIGVDVQWNTAKRQHCPADAEFRQWANTAIAGDEDTSVQLRSPLDNGNTDSENCDEASLTIRVVDADEMQLANYQWRQFDKPTNVLSFPSEFPPETELKYYGDILICAEVVLAESIEQHKDPQAHWAHITIHGVLHLLGYDHIASAEAEVMERREIEILATLGFDNPYISKSGITQSEVSKT